MNGAGAAQAGAAAEFRAGEIRDARAPPTATAYRASASTLVALPLIVNCDCRHVSLPRDSRCVLRIFPRLLALSTLDGSGAAAQIEPRRQTHDKSLPADATGLVRVGIIISRFFDAVGSQERRMNALLASFSRRPLSHCGRRSPPRHLPAAAAAAAPGKAASFCCAAGKAAGSMAETAEDFYLNRLKLPAERLCGVAVARHGYGRPTRVVRMIEAGHPVPDAAGLEAAQLRARSGRWCGPRRSGAGADVGRRFGQLDRAGATGFHLPTNKR